MTPQQTNDILKWKLGIFETVAIVGSIVTIALGAVDRFQSKSEASIRDLQHDKQVEEVRVVQEKRNDQFREAIIRINARLDPIAADTAYMRGRMEKFTK